MADGSGYLQQSIGTTFYQNHTPKPSLPAGAAGAALANGTFLQSLLNQFVTNPLHHSNSHTNPPSPSRSPDRQQGSSLSHTPLPMYSHNQQQGQHSRLNNNPGGRQLPIHYNFQQPSGLQHQPHAQHHPSLQQEHSGQGSGAGILGHHASYSGNALQNAGPFGGGLLNGHSTDARGGQAGQTKVHESWAKQLQLHKKAVEANATMIEQNAPHFFARSKAQENKGVASSPAPAAASAAEDETRRPIDVSSKTAKQQFWHSLDMSGQQIRTLAPKLFSYTFLQELYISSNKLSSLTPAIGELRQLRVLEASHNLLEELPPEIGMCTFLKQLHVFNNEIKTLPHELGSLHHLEVLGIEGNPLNAETKNIIKTKGTPALISELREKLPVPMPPMPRPVVPIQEDVAPSLERIKVFSWNILCEKYATTTIYGYTPKGALEWTYRLEKILQEIRDSDADFVCLQEVNTEAFREDFMPELSKLDYKGIHYVRTKAKTMDERGAAVVDGCAIFYKHSKFKMLDKTVVEIMNIAINRPDMKSSPDVFNRVMPKDNIAALGFFESILTGARMIVVNAHLAWEGHLADVKIVQTAIILEQVTKLAERYARWPACKDKKMIRLPRNADSDDDEVEEKLVEPAPSQEYRNNTDIPLFVCGDYNSTKESGVFELLSKGRLAPDHAELKNFKYGNFSHHGIEHPFSLRSAYQGLNGTPNEMPFTNYTPSFSNVIDWIWYSTNNLEVVSLLGPPDAQHLKRVPGFPNYHFPADHIQLVAEFVIKARKDGKKVTAVNHGGSSAAGPSGSG